MKTRLAAATALLALALPFAAIAQDAPAKGPDAHKQIKHLTKALSLTDDQASKLEPILADRNTKLVALKQDTTSPRRDRMMKAKTINDDANTQINTILTPDQQKQYAQMQDEMKKKMMERRQNKMGGSSDPPPQV